MNQLTTEQVREGFRILGLETEEQRAEFIRFAQSAPPEDQQEFIRLDFASQNPEAAQHAELA